MTSYRRRATVLAATAALALIGAMPVAEAAMPTDQGKTALLPADLSFVLHAAEGGNAEVALGKLASEKATDDNIKQFGHKMAMDHAVANKELTALANSKGATPPNEPGAAAVVIMEALEASPAERFNQDYMAQQVGDHVLALAMFEHCAESCMDAEVKAFAAKHAPDIEAHLKLAQQLLAKAKQQASAQ
jgi:putative membrane protein